jgi:hypothetical protein
MLNRKDLAAYRRFRRWHEKKYGQWAILASAMSGFAQDRDGLGPEGASAAPKGGDAL